MVLETIRMAPKHPRTVSEGPGSAPEVSGMSRNGPDMSRKVLEASRRSWKVPDSTTHSPAPLDSTTHSPAPLDFGGKPPRQPWSARRGEAHQGGGILLQVGLPIPVLADFRWEGVGSFGRLGSPSWTPKPP